MTLLITREQSASSRGHSKLKGLLVFWSATMLCAILATDGEMTLKWVSPETGVKLTSGFAQRDFMVLSALRLLGCAVPSKTNVGTRMSFNHSCGARNSRSFLLRVSKGRLSSP